MIKCTHCDEQQPARTEICPNTGKVILTGANNQELLKKRKLNGGWTLVVILSVLAVVYYQPLMEKIVGKSESETNPQLEAGSIKISPLDGVDMVYVPEGDFEMGSNDWDFDEIPAHNVFLDAYWLYKYEVTNQNFSQFVTETEYVTYAEKEDVSMTYKDAWVKTEGAYWNAPEGPGSTSIEDHPVVNVSWNDADEYCKWAGGRLPSEAEWEKAARGTDDRLYPWGDEINSSLLNYEVNVGTTTPVGSYPEGASPYGALDMAGNVWEWTGDWFNEYYYSESPSENPSGPEDGDFRVVRGGSWRHYDWFQRVSVRIRGSLDNTYVNLGFRCAASPISRISGISTP